jgi:hypothetical protein
MYFAELDAIAAVLPLRPRGAGEFDAPPGALSRRLFGHRPFVDRIARRSVFVSPQAIAHSEFSLLSQRRRAVRGYRTLPELFGQIAAALRRGRRARLYLRLLRGARLAGPQHGVGSTQVAAQFALLDEAFGAFLAAIAGSDTLVLACADHGFIDSPPERQIDLAQHPDLAATLVRPLCGERRVVYCYVRPGQDGPLRGLPVRAISTIAWTPSRAGRCIEAGLVRAGTADPRLASRIGDYVLVMRDDWTLQGLGRGREAHRQIGVHAGVSADEMLVPLIVADCDA